MKRCLVFAVIVLLLGACVSMHDQVTAACSAYHDLKPHYPELRAFALAHRDRIPVRVWTDLELFDQRAADIDALISALCAASSDEEVKALLASRTDARVLLGLVLRVGAVYLQMRVSG